MFYLDPEERRQGYTHHNSAPWTASPYDAEPPPPPPPYNPYDYLSHGPDHMTDRHNHMTNGQDHMTHPYDHMTNGHDNHHFSPMHIHESPRQVLTGPNQRRKKSYSTNESWMNTILRKLPAAYLKQRGLNSQQDSQQKSPLPSPNNDQNKSAPRSPTCKKQAEKGLPTDEDILAAIINKMPSKKELTKKRNSKDMVMENRRESAETQPSQEVNEAQ